MNNICLKDIFYQLCRNWLLLLTTFWNCRATKRQTWHKMNPNISQMIVLWVPKIYYELYKLYMTSHYPHCNWTCLLSYNAMDSALSISAFDFTAERLFNIIVFNWGFVEVLTSLNSCYSLWSCSCTNQKWWAKNKSVTCGHKVPASFLSWPVSVECRFSVSFSSSFISKIPDWKANPVS